MAFWHSRSGRNHMDISLRHNVISAEQRSLSSRVVRRQFSFRSYGLPDYPQRHLFRSDIGESCLRSSVRIHPNWILFCNDPHDDYHNGSRCIQKRL